MPPLALYTFGVLTSPLADPTPLTREFYDMGEAVYRKMSQHPGYLAHADAADDARGALFETDWGVWGEFAVPTWYDKGRTAETTALAATLSLWTDLRPAVDALYTDLHREALKGRDDWFERTEHPTYALWWAWDGAIPTWQDGVSRLEHLHAHGSTPRLHLPHPFSPDGTWARTTGVGRKNDRVR